MKSLHTRRMIGIVLGLLMVATTASWGAAAPSGALTVTVKYSGPGTVDESHGLHVFVFDTPNIAAGVIPIGYQKLTANNAAATFEGLTASPVYLAFAFDEQGGYDPNVVGPPPSGTPVYIHGEDGTPTGVEVAEGAELEVTFDDSNRMP